jgi:hypothetical protein
MHLVNVRASWIGYLVCGAIALAAACAPRSLLTERERVTELAPGCDGCISDLVGCVATSRGDPQFMQCRDLFAACQSKEKLGAGTCENPRGADACAACAEQRRLCELTDADPQRCPEDEAQCMARLGGASCGAVETPDDSGGAGGDCLECAAGAGGASTSASGAGGGGATGGSAPTQSCHEPCQLGDPMLDSCSSCAASVCAADSYCCTTAWDKYCVKAALDVPACGCTTSSCTHSECSPGPALVAGCSNCAIGVCAVMPTCCQVEWTSACVVEAASFESCGCAGF